jgi:hypothetical protein
VTDTTSQFYSEKKRVREIIIEMEKRRSDQKCTSRNLGQEKRHYHVSRHNPHDLLTLSIYIYIYINYLLVTLN